MSIPALKIGTRGSPLALAQTRETRARLAEAHGVAPEHFEIVIIRTSGDVIQDRALSEAGGKGLFTRELDLALIAGEIDFAVHSSKDLPTELPPEIVIAGYLPREDTRDAFIGRGGAKLGELPQGAVIGTASLRRAAQVKRFRADLKTVLLRGNVETRLAKVESGAVDGTLLALAGLRRLGLAARATEILPLEAFLPAAGQGAVGVTSRRGDEIVSAALAPILDAGTYATLSAERAFLKALDGSCRTPIAGLAVLEGEALRFRGEALQADGGNTYAASGTGPVAEAASVGAGAAREILKQLPGGVASLS
jgi:hydroxymethylbilane synthase